jgi:hypothetical protein
MAAGWFFLHSKFGSQAQSLTSIPATAPRAYASTHQWPSLLLPPSFPNGNQGSGTIKKVSIYWHN